MRTLNWYSSTRFGIWRAGFGFYLLVYAILEFPYRHEFFSSNGVMPLPISSIPLTAEALKSVYNLYWDDRFVTPLHVFGLWFSLMIIVGLFRRWAAFGLFLCHFFLINRNLATSAPQGQLVSWLLLFCALVPSGEAYSVMPRPKRDWKMPLGLLVAAWVTLASAYMLAGVLKLSDDAWLEGMAIRWIFFKDASRFEWVTKLPIFPWALTVTLTYAALLIEIGFPLALPFERARKWWWFSSVAMNLGLLFTMQLQKITLGMLFFSALLFDPRWLPNLFRGAGKR